MSDHVKHEDSKLDFGYLINFRFEIVGWVAKPPAR
jgi:hypothetical protein